MESISADMIELLDSLGQEIAIWVGHDWGSPVVWNIASHHPDRCQAVASLCIPYHTIEYGLDSIIELVDRETYPEAEYPAGQWEYMRFYEEHFHKASTAFEADTTRTVKALFRSGLCSSIDGIRCDTVLLAKRLPTIGRAAIYRNTAEEDKLVYAGQGSAAGELHGAFDIGS